MKYDTTDMDPELRGWLWNIRASKRGTCKRTLYPSCVALLEEYGMADLFDKQIFATENEVRTAIKDANISGNQYIGWYKQFNNFPSYPPAVYGYKTWNEFMGIDNSFAPEDVVRKAILASNINSKTYNGWYKQFGNFPQGPHGVYGYKTWNEFLGVDNSFAPEDVVRKAILKAGISGKEYKDGWYKQFDKFPSQPQNTYGYKTWTDFLGTAFAPEEVVRQTIIENNISRTDYIKRGMYKQFDNFPLYPHNTYGYRNWSEFLGTEVIPPPEEEVVRQTIIENNISRNDYSHRGMYKQFDNFPVNPHIIYGYKNWTEFMEG